MSDYHADDGLPIGAGHKCRVCGRELKRVGMVCSDCRRSSARDEVAEYRRDTEFCEKAGEMG